MKHFPLFFVLLVNPLTVLAGPFGFDVTDDPRKLEICDDTENEFFLKCSTAPNPHPEMDYYIINFVPQVGVCMIKGVGKDIIDNSFGQSTRSTADNINRQISIKYGKETRKYDDLLPGSIWNEPEDWMMGLLKDERIYLYHWDLASTIDGISEIYVAAKATGRDSAYIVTEFYTPNNDACDEAMEKAAASSF